MSFQTGDVRTDFQVSCPYNPSHRMPEDRLIFHITNGCKDKKDKAHLFAHCPYNFMHIIRKENLDQHITKCKSKPNDFDSIKNELIDAVNKQFGNQAKNQQQEQILVPGQLASGDNQKKKRVRNRNRKQKQEDNKDQDQEDDLPKWGDDDNQNKDQSEYQQESKLEQSGEQIERQYIEENQQVFNEDIIQKEEKNNDYDDWNEVGQQKQGKRRNNKRKK